MSLQRIDAVAWACLLGVDGWGLLTCEDPFERRLRLELVERAWEMRRRMARNDAVEIAHALAQAMR